MNSLSFSLTRSRSFANPSAVKLTLNVRSSSPSPLPIISPKIPNPMMILQFDKTKKTNRLLQCSLISQIRIRIKNPNYFKVILRSDYIMRRFNNMNRGKCYPLIGWDFSGKSIHGGDEKGKNKKPQNLSGKELVM